MSDYMTHDHRCIRHSSSLLGSRPSGAPDEWYVPTLLAFAGAHSAPPPTISKCILCVPGILRALSMTPP